MLLIVVLALVLANWVSHRKDQLEGLRTKLTIAEALVNRTEERLEGSNRSLKLGYTTTAGNQTDAQQYRRAVRERDLFERQIQRLETQAWTLIFQ